MKISNKSAASSGDAKISKVQQKLGLKKTGKVSKTSTKPKGKEFKAEVKVIFKKDIPNILKVKKQKAVVEETPVETKLSKFALKNTPKKVEKKQNGIKNPPTEIEKAKKIVKDVTQVKVKQSKAVKVSPSPVIVPKESKITKQKKKKSNPVAPIVSLKQKALKQQKAVLSDADPEVESPKKVKKETKLLSEDSKPSIPDQTIVQAIDVINQLNLSFQKKKNELFAEETPLLLQIDSIKIPQCTKRKLRFQLPHTLVTDTSDVCLFVCDLKRGKKVDHEPTVQHYEDILREKGITNIKTIIPVRQIRVEYDQMEMKRRLLTQYDFFLTDARISGLLAHKLGSVFFNKNQLPTPIRMDATDLKEEIDKALHKTVMRLHGEGTTFSLRVGNGKQTPRQICENIQAALLQVDKMFPGKWNNIRSVHVKTPRSMAIPIYLTLRNKNAIKRTIVKPLHSTDEMVEGDLSTLLGASVQVFKSGKVVVKRNKDNKDNSDDESTPAKKSKPDKKAASAKSKGKIQPVLAEEKKSMVPDSDEETADSEVESDLGDEEVGSDEEVEEVSDDGSDDESD